MNLNVFVAYRVEEDWLLVRFSDEATVQRPLRKGEEVEDQVRKTAVSYLLGCLAFGIPVLTDEKTALQDWESHWSQVKMLPEQVDLLLTTSILYGIIPSLTPPQLAEAFGVTRQAVHSRIKHKTLTCVQTPVGPKVPIPSLQGRDLTKALAFLSKEPLHAQG